MPLATLSIDLEARLAKLQDGFDKATRLSERTANEIRANFDRLNGIAGALGIGIASAFSADAIRTFITTTIDGIDAMNDLADATGASIENISALDDVARRTGTTLDTAGSILVKFNAALKDADPKSAAAQAIKALGLSIEDLKKLDPAEALRQTAVALAGFADDGNKARLVQELFGKSIREAAPFLKDLSEQTKLVGTVTKESAEEAEKFNKNIFALQANVNSLSRSIVNATVPAINQLIDRFKEGSKEGKTFFTVIGEEYERIVREQKKILGLQQGFTDGRGGSIRQAPTGNAARAALYGSSGYGDTSPSLPSLPSISSVKGGPAAKAGPKLDYYNLQDFMGPLLPSPDGPNIPDEILKVRDALDKLLESGNSARAKALANLGDELERQFMAGYISAEQFADGVDSLNRSFDALTPKVEATKTEIDEFAKEAQRNIQDAFGDTLLQAISGNFENIGQLWVNLLKRMVAEALAAKLNKYLFGDGGSDKGATGDAFVAIAKLFASANGNAFGPGGVIPFAAGGVVNSATLFSFGRGQTGVMGEAGPEAIMPLKRGADGKLGIAAGSAPITIVNHTTGRIDRATESRGPGGERVLTLDEVAASMYDPNSRMSRAFRDNYRAQRNR